MKQDNKRQVSFELIGNMSLIQALQDKGINVEVNYSSNKAYATFDSTEHPLYQKLQRILNKKACQAA